MAIGDAVKVVESTAAPIVGTGITASFSGAAQAFADAQAGLLVLLILAIAVIYIVLGILYESFIHPLTILTGLPFAGFGALLTLLIFRQDLSVYAFVGIILLVGLVKKNAIMMIDFAIESERTGKGPEAAILEAASARFRPIMMTTMAALDGHAAHRARGRGRRRIASSPRPGRRGRAGIFAARHALHHAGLLRPLRRIAALVRDPAGRIRGPVGRHRISTCLPSV